MQEDGEPPKLCGSLSGGTVTSNVAIIVFGLVALSIVVMQVMRTASRSKLAFWRQLADAEKLRLDDEGEAHTASMSGIYRGVRVEVDVGGGHLPPALKLFTRIRAELPGAGPPGLLITSEASLVGRLRRVQAPQIEIDDPEVGGNYTVHGFDLDKTTEVVLNRGVRSALLELRSQAQLVHVDEVGVRVETLGIAGVNLASLLQATSRLAAGISEAYEQAWSDFAKQHGLVFLGAGTRGERTLRGYMGGTRVTIQTGPMPNNPELQFSTIKVGIDTRLPAGFRVVPRAFSPPVRGEIQVGDEQVDEIMQVTGTNREAVTALLTHPPLRDHLVAFFDACPYTMIEGGQVIAGGPGLIGGDLEGQVRAVEELAGSFKDAWTQVSARLEAERLAEEQAAAEAAEAAG